MQREAIRHNAKRGDDFRILYSEHRVPEGRKNPGIGDPADGETRDPPVWTRGIWERYRIVAAGPGGQDRPEPVSADPPSGRELQFFAGNFRVSGIFGGSHSPDLDSESVWSVSKIASFRRFAAMDRQYCRSLEFLNFSDLHSADCSLRICCFLAWREQI